MPLQEKKWSQSGILPRKCPAEPGERTRARLCSYFLEELPKQQRCNQTHRHRRPHSHQVQITLPPPTPPAELFAPLPSINYHAAATSVFGLPAMNHCRRNVQLGLVPQQAVPVVGSSKLAEKEKEWAEAERRCIGRWGAILTPEQGKRLNKYRAEHVYLLQAGSNGDCPNSQYGISKCAKCGGSDNLKICNVWVRYPNKQSTSGNGYEVGAVACCIGCARFDYNLCREHDCWNETDVHHNPFCSLHAWEGRGRAIESGKSELYFKADRYNKEELERMSPKRLRDTLKREAWHLAMQPSPHW